MYSLVILAYMASYALAGPVNDKTSVDLLKNDFTRHKDVKKISNWISFGRKSSAILLDNEILKELVKNIDSHKEKTFTTIANLRKFDETGRSTLVSLESILSNRKYFEVYIKRVEGYAQSIEGSDQGDSKIIYHYRLGITYVSNGRHVDHMVPLNGKFKPGRWFTLMIRLIGNSNIEVTFDCELIENAKLGQPMDEIPIYVKARLAQSVEEEFWTFQKIITHRFIGDIKKANFLFGKASFLSNNPCKDHMQPGMVLEGAETKKQGGLDAKTFVIESLVDIGHSDCYIGWSKVEHGEEWKEGSCNICKCQHGAVSCSWKEHCFESIDP